MKRKFLIALCCAFSLTWARVSAADVELVTLNVGDVYEGGVVFFVDHSAHRALVVSLAEAPDTLRYRTWGECGLSTAAASVDSGLPNSAALLSAQVVVRDINARRDNPNAQIDFVLPADTIRRAAHWCASLVDTGKTEWFLPAREQLKLLYEAKASVNPALQTLGVATLGEGYYWSSTQRDAYEAWYVFFDDGEVGSSLKSNVGHVRAVREVAIPYQTLTYAITFNIVDSASNAAIADAAITLDSTRLDGLTDIVEGGTYTYVVSKSGYISKTVSVTVTDADITVEVKLAAIPTTGISSSKLVLNLYPTITTGLVQVSGVEATTAIEVEVYAASGSRLLRSTYRESAFSLDLSALPAGTLFVKISAGGKSTTVQVVKQ
jgi:hypothetical protein